MKISRSMMLAVALLALTAAPPARAAETIGTSVVFTGNIQQTIDSHVNNVGDRFTIVLVPPYPAHSLAGAEITGHVSALRRAAQGTNPYIHLAFDSIILANGARYPLHAELLQDQVLRDNQNTGRIIATTGGAALLGGLIGHGVGAVVGGGAGYLYSSNYRDNVHIPNGSQIRVLTTAPTEI